VGSEGPNGSRESWLLTRLWVWFSVYGGPLWPAGSVEVAFAGGSPRWSGAEMGGVGPVAPDADARGARVMGTGGVGNGRSGGDMNGERIPPRSWYAEGTKALSADPKIEPLIGPIGPVAPVGPVGPA
jgi:hypothetical protein